MINAITGKIVALSQHHVSLVAGCFSFEIYVPTVHEFKLDTEVTINTYMHWNQEQGPTLYGFATSTEKLVFLSAISCPGVGPKIGLAIIADLGASRFVQAIQTEDAQLLSSVNGIGVKKAEQIIVQLKHKIGTLVDHIGVHDNGASSQWRLVTQALESLNYSRTEINQAVMHTKNKQQGQEKFDQLLRSALSYLAKRP